jgi:hypothetical protein
MKIIEAVYLLLTAASCFLSGFCCGRGLRHSAPVIEASEVDSVEFAFDCDDGAVRVGRFVCPRSMALRCGENADLN